MQITATKCSLFARVVDGAVAGAEALEARALAQVLVAHALTGALDLLFRAWNMHGGC